MPQIMRLLWNQGYRMSALRTCVRRLRQVPKGMPVDLPLQGIHYYHFINDIYRLCMI
jgi:hypothetical protein